MSAGDREQLIGRLARVAAPPPAHVHAQLVLHRLETALERADHAGSDAAGVPVHAHHGAEGLKPEGMGEPRQQLVRAVVVYDHLGDDPPEPGHAPPEPGRDPAAMQW